MASDRGLMHAIVATHAWAKAHTAPILFCRAGNPRDVIGVASGVPCRLFGRFFLLTAGHVLGGLDESVRLLIGTPIPPDADRVFGERPLAVDVPSWALTVTSDGVDAGFLELVPKDAESETRLFRHSVAESHISLAADADFEHALVTLSGHPSMAKMDASSPSVQLLCYTTGVAGKGGGPEVPSSLGISPDERNVVLWIQERDAEQAEQHDPYRREKSVDLAPLLSGMSGGGYWLTRQGDEEPLFIGTHASSTPSSYLIGTSLYRFARGTLLGTHLALVAYHHPELAEGLMERWPSLWRHAPLTRSEIALSRPRTPEAIRIRAPRAPRDRSPTVERGARKLAQRRRFNR